MVKSGADIHSENHKSATPLHLAVEGDHLEAAKKLIALGAQIDGLEKKRYFPVPPDPDRDAGQALFDLEVTRTVFEPFRRSILHAAIHNNNADMVEILLKNGASPESVHNDYTPLQEAVLQKNSRIVDLLLENEADVRACDSNGSIPLHYAAQEGAPEVVKTLIGRWFHRLVHRLLLWK